MAKKAASRLISKAENAFDIACGTLGDLPNITLYGTSRAEIDNFKGLLDFSPNAVRLNTTDGILRIDGTELSLGFMTNESICVKGKIKNLCFE
ncbi:MAG: YabP/YqfC family sporulation protein [Clostridia bacterium]|nr:YabP/YqfC family sporulation protein [Clostridia bacterium]